MTAMHGADIPSATVPLAFMPAFSGAAIEETLLPTLSGSVNVAVSKDPLNAVLADEHATESRMGDNATPPSRLDYLETLVKASHAINGTLDPTEVANILADHTAAILGVTGICVLQIDAKSMVRVVASRGLSSDYLREQAGPLAGNIAGRALDEARTFAAWDLRQHTDSRVAQAAEAEGIHSVACAPMLFGGAAVGALTVHCHEPRCFDDDAFHVLSLLAAQGAVALTNARAYGELRAQASEVRSGFLRVGEALSASLDIGETLRLIVQLSVEMTRADGGAFFSLQDADQGGGVRLAAMRGLDRRAVRRFRRAPLTPHAEKALSTGKAVVLGDTRKVTDTAFPTLRLAVDRTGSTHSVVSIPVMVGDRPLGILEQYATTTDHFSRADIQLLSSFALQASVAIENARLYAQERGIAQTLQRAFLPELPPTIGGFEIGRIYAPGSEIEVVGGDTYDLFALPDGRIASVIGDISGKGVHAATLAVMAKYTVRAYALDEADPSRILSRVNEALIPQTGDSTFLTMIVGIIDPVTRRVELASAAHPAPLIWRASQRIVETLEIEPGLIAGFLHNQSYPSTVFHLDPGDAIVLYTDGVTEARRKKVLFSTEDRFAKVIAENAHLSAQDIAAAIYNAVVDWASGERTDDIALLVLKAN